MEPLYGRDQLTRFGELEEAYENERIAITKAVCTIIEAIAKHQERDKYPYYRPVSHRNPEFYKIEYWAGRNRAFISFVDGNDRDTDSVPLDYLTTPDWLSLYMQEEGLRRDEQKKKAQEVQEAKERAELERLKAKYGERP